jgi:hypothetical protein
MTQQLSDTLLLRLKKGRLFAAAEGADWDDGDGSHTRGITAIDRSWWEHERQIAQHGTLWRHGDITLLATEPHATAGYPVAFFGVRFEFSAFRELLAPLPKILTIDFGSIPSSDTRRVPPADALGPQPASEHTRPTVEVPKHAGGRPAWAGWEGLWAEIGAQLYCGDLKPKKQADIEQAMLAIAERTDDGPKIATIRTRARRLWVAIKADG